MQVRGALLAIFLTCGTASAETVTIKALGVSLEKPNGWHDVTPAAYRDNFSKIQTDNRELQELIRKNAATPFIAFTKFPEPHPELNPSFRISVRPFNPPPGFDDIQFLNLVVQQQSKLFPDIKVDKGPTQATFGGLAAVYVKMSYTISANGQNWPTTSAMWMARRGSEAFVAGVGRATGAKGDVLGELEKVVQSVTIAP